MYSPVLSQDVGQEDSKSICLACQWSTLTQGESHWAEISNPVTKVSPAMSWLARIPFSSNFLKKCFYLKDSLARYKILGSHCLFFEYLLYVTLLSLGVEGIRIKIWYESHFTSGSFCLVSPKMASLSLKFNVTIIYLRVQRLGQFSLNIACHFDMWTSLFSGKFSWILFINICSAPLFWFSSLMLPASDVYVDPLLPFFSIYNFLANPFIFISVFFICFSYFYAIWPLSILLYAPCSLVFIFQNVIIFLFNFFPEIYQVKSHLFLLFGHLICILFFFFWWGQVGGGN